MIKLSEIRDKLKPDVMGWINQAIASAALRGITISLPSNVAYTDVEQSFTERQWIINTFVPDSGNVKAGLTAQIQIDPTSNDTTTFVTGVRGIAQTNEGNIYNAYYLQGVTGNVTHGGTGTIDSAYGLRGGITTLSTGDITNAWGLDVSLATSTGAVVTNWQGIEINIPTAAAGAITNAIGLRVRDQNGFGTSTNVIGIGIEDQTAGTKTINLMIGDVFSQPAGTWNIYSASTLASYFAGNITAPNLRDKLTANRTYYVRTDGSDSNTGLVDSAGGAFLTIQKAVDVACSLDLATYAITIDVGNGTYTGAVTLKTFVGVGPITIIGDETTPSNVVISTTSANCFSADAIYGLWQLKGMRTQTTTSGTCIQVTKGSQVEYQNIDFGACATIHLVATQGGIITATGNSTISGAALYHYYADTSGIIYDNTHTVTSTGTHAYVVFAYASKTAIIYAILQTYTGGTITGQRYNVSLNATIDTGGGGANYFPGNVAGATDGYGAYA